MYARPLTNACPATLKDDDDDDNDNDNGDKNQNTDEEFANEMREPGLRPLEDLARPRVRAEETNPFPFVHRHDNFPLLSRQPTPDDRLIVAVKTKVCEINTVH